MKNKNNLALFGGEPRVKNHKNLRISWPIVTEQDRRSVQRVFEQEDFSGRGSPEIYQLEKEFSSKFGGLYSTAFNSGTAALHAGLVALGIKPGDEVVVPALSFIASALAVVHNHSIPVFADIDPLTYNISVESVKKKITPRTKAVIVVHLHGFPANIKDLLLLCKENNLKLIEDVAQAPGAMISGKLVGTFGDASIFSLMSQKNLPTCGEAGILLTQTLEAKNRAEMVRIYGEILLPNKERLYNSFTLGWNYTLNPIQAAMARSQLKRFFLTTTKIQKAGRKLTSELSQFKWLILPKEGKKEESVFHFYRVRLKPSFFSYKDTGRFRKAVQNIMAAEGLHVRLYQNTPLPGHPIFKYKNKTGGGIPWSCSKSNIQYNILDYPHTLETIRGTVVIGGISSAPGYLLCKGTIKKYVDGFKKIEENIDAVLKYADTLDYKEPWEELAMASDSFKAKYLLRDD